MARTAKRSKKQAPEPKCLTITDMEQVRLLTDPLRLKLLEVFAQGAATTKQVAEKLGEKPTRLYHHVEALEKVGLIKLVRTRQNRGAVEKYYEAIAQRFIVEAGLFTGGKRDEAASDSVTMARSVINTTHRELMEALEHPERCSHAAPAILTRATIEASAEDVRKLHKQILDLMRDIQQLSRDKPESERKESYTLSLFFHPTANKES